MSQKFVPDPEPLPRAQATPSPNLLYWPRNHDWVSTMGFLRSLWLLLGLNLVRIQNPDYFFQAFSSHPLFSVLLSLASSNLIDSLRSRYNSSSDFEVPHCLKTHQVCLTPATLSSGPWRLWQGLNAQLGYISYSFLHGHVTQIWHWNWGRNYVLYL